MSRRERFLSCVLLLPLLGGSCVTLSVTPGEDRWEDGVYLVRGRRPKARRHYRSIQAAIDRARRGDTIYVSAGTYSENIVMKEGLNLIGDGAETTIIDGGGRGIVVLFESVANGTLTGFTIRNSGDTNYPDAGIRCVASSPTISENIVLGMYNILCEEGSSPEIRDNILKEGVVGIYCDSSSPLIIGNTISDHTHYGIFCAEDSSVFVCQNIIVRNSTGVYCGGTGRAIIMNNTIGKNSDRGISTHSRRKSVVKNNIIFMNRFGGLDAVSRVAFNNVWMNHPDYRDCKAGEGDVSTEPGFVSSEKDIYLLAADSCSIDKGDPAQAYIDEDGSRNDIGATGGRRQSYGRWDWNLLYAGSVEGDPNSEKLLTSSDPYLRTNVVQELGVMEAEEATALLIMALQDGNQVVRMQAVMQLSNKEKGKLVMATLHQALDDSDSSVRTAAAEGLSRFGHPDGISFLISALQTDYAWDAAQKLETVTGQHFGDNPGLWKKWWLRNKRKFIRGARSKHNLRR